MLAVEFNQQNLILNKPEGMQDTECSPLPVHRGLDANNYPFMVSCWQLSKEDLEEINRTGIIWLHVVAIGHPPVLLTTENPFE